MGTPNAAQVTKPKPKAKPKKRPPPSQPAPVEAARGTGFSRDFQFAEVQWANAYFASYLDGKLVFSLSVSVRWSAPRGRGASGAGVAFS